MAGMLELKRVEHMIAEAGNAMERWRAQLNVTTEQEEAAEEGAAPEGGEGEPEVAAAEYEYLAEGEGAQQGDTQAMAPATEDQAAAANLPDPDAGVGAEETAAQASFFASASLLDCIPKRQHEIRPEYAKIHFLHGQSLSGLDQTGQLWCSQPASLSFPRFQILQEQYERVQASPG